MIERTDDFDLETWVQSVGINISGSFTSPRQRERSHGTKVSLTSTGAIVHKSEKAIDPPENKGISEGAHVRNIHASTWSASDVLCGDDSSVFRKGTYYSSGSSDGAARGF